MSVSLLRLCKPRLRAAARPLASAFLATDAMPPLSGDADAEFFQGFSDQPASAIDDGPPLAPDTAYPPAAPPPGVNPFREPTADLLTQVRPTYAVYVKSSRSNTITTLTRPDGNPLKTLTGGKVGFKGGNRSSYEAGYKCAVEIFKRLEEEMEKDDVRWQLYLNGFGYGREAVQRALMAEEGSKVKAALVRITDKTPIKVGGTRAQKQKRR